MHSQSTDSTTSTDPSSFFGHLTFNTNEMSKRLPPPVAKSLARTIAQGEKLDPSIVDAVALAMTSVATAEKSCWKLKGSEICTPTDKTLFRERTSCIFAIFVVH